MPKILGKKNQSFKDGFEIRIEENFFGRSAESRYQLSEKIKVIHKIKG